MENFTSKICALRNGSKIVVLGGGPAGSFFAIHLLKLAKKFQKDIRITIIDKCIPRDPSGQIQKFRGCNFCAGIISPRLQEELAKNNIRLPSEVICENFSKDHVSIYG